MRQVSFIFATGESRLDFLVTTITNSSWSHVALRFDEENLIVESLAFRGCILQAGNKYDGWAKSRTIRLEVSKDVYFEMLALARRWGTQNIPYGYATCVAIGIKELLGARAGKVALGWLPGTDGSTLVCSEMLVKLWRIGFPDFLPGRDPRLVSPDELYRTLLQSSVEIKQ